MAKTESAEQKRLKSRLLEIYAEASRRAANESASDGPLMSALNLAEEAAQHGLRLHELGAEAK